MERQINSEFHDFNFNRATITINKLFCQAKILPEQGYTSHGHKLRISHALWKCAPQRGHATGHVAWGLCPPQALQLSPFKLYVKVSLNICFTREAGGGFYKTEAKKAVTPKVIGSRFRPALALQLSLSYQAGSPGLGQGLFNREP